MYEVVPRRVGVAGVEANCQTRAMRFGNRLDRVEYDPGFHWMLKQGIERELAGLPWRDPRPGAHVVRAAMFILANELDTGPCCPGGGRIISWSGKTKISRAINAAYMPEPSLLTTPFQTRPSRSMKSSPSTPSSSVSALRLCLSARSVRKHTAL